MATHRLDLDAAVQLHPVRARPTGEGVGHADLAAGPVGVDQVGGGQGPQRLVQVKVQLGGYRGDHLRLGWSGVGEEPAEQATVEAAQRLGQAGLSLLDAADG